MRFTREHFDGKIPEYSSACFDMHQEIANVANAVLEEELAKAPKVFTHCQVNGYSTWAEYRCKPDIYSARLVDISGDLPKWKELKRR